MGKSGRENGRFYTPADVAAKLVAMLDGTPKNVLDLGCGKGALSRAAVERWGTSIYLTTIDNDPAAGPVGGPWADHHRHYEYDLLGSERSESTLERGSFDVAVLNPPYGRRPMKSTSGGHCLDQTFSWESARCRSTLFMMHALEALRPGGRLAAILPETLAIGTAAGPSRRLITGLGLVEQVSPLPPNTFSNTEARTVMVLARRELARDGTTDAWAVNGASHGSAGAHHHRLRSTIGELGVKVVRGRLSTSEARSAGAFHLDAFRSARDGLVSLPEEGEDHDHYGARAGDILIARVGRNISDKVVLVEAGSNAISDCVYRLRCPPKVAKRVWSGLRSSAGKRQLEESQSGLTTRLLPLGNLMTLRV